MWTNQRVSRNRRDTVLIVILLVAVLAPVVLGIGYLVSTYLLRYTASHTRSLASDVRLRENALEMLRSRGGSSEWLEQDIAQKRAALAQSRESDRSAFLPMMLVTATGIAGCLGLLLWTTAWSPTTRLLAHSGALPAGSAESETTALLKDLAARAGLPPPKLYIIESALPSIFADGTDPRSASIAVTRGALDLLDHREIAGLLAHQLSHIANRDIGLNTLLASMATFMKLPYVFLRGKLFHDGRLSKTRVAFVAFQLLISPLSLYVFFVAPLLGRLIRAVTSRDREYLADADAVSLTGDPQGLLSALAKIAGASAAAGGANPAFAHVCLSDPKVSGSWFGSGLAAHPPLTKRMDRLAGLHGVSSVSGLQEAVDQGKLYAGQHKSMAEEHTALPTGPHDDMAAINRGHVMGRVYRVLSSDPVPVYDSDGHRAFVIAWVKPGDLVVAFDDPGKMRQVNTVGEVFGYLDRKVKLKAVAGVLPQEVYHPELRAAAEEALARREAAAPAAQPQPRLKRDSFVVTMGFLAAGLAGLTILVFVLLK